MGVVLALRNARTPDKAIEIPASTRNNVIGIRAGSRYEKPGVKRANSHANATQKSATTGGGILRSSVGIVLRCNTWVK